MVSLTVTAHNNYYLSRFHLSKRKFSGDLWPELLSEFFTHFLVESMGGYIWNSIMAYSHIFPLTLILEWYWK